jgi:hypothetical protein
VASKVDWKVESLDEPKIDDETKNQDDITSRTCKLFQVFFLMNDGEQSVEVLEIAEIDLEEIMDV